MIRFFFIAIIIILVLIPPTSALAHKVKIFAFVESGIIHTKSSFNCKRPVTNGTLEVRDAYSNKLLLTGTTNNEGEWSFPIPQSIRDKKLDLLLIIKAGKGHQGQRQISAIDYLEKGSNYNKTPIETVRAFESETNRSTPAMQHIDIIALEQVVNRLIEAKVEPLRKEIIETETNDPGAAEIFGGLGFLMGLAGLIMASRRSHS